MTSRRSSTSVIAVAIAVVGLVLAGFASPASAASSTGKLKGLVTLDGVPVTSAEVQLYRNVRDPERGDDAVKPVRVATDRVDSQGRYTFSRVTIKPSISYEVVVSDPTGRTARTSRGVGLKKGRTITKNVHLRAGVTLQGTITRSSGASPAGLTVSVDTSFQDERGPAYDIFQPTSSAPVNADGTFALKGAGGTSFDQVMVSDGRFALQCYDFVLAALADCIDGDQAAFQRQRVQLAPGETRTLPTVVSTKPAPPVSQLSGRVTDTSGRGLKGINVSIQPVAPGRYGDRTVTRSSGRYALPPLPSGTYIVEFNDGQGRLRQQYVGGDTRAAAQRIVVTGGTNISGLDARLKSATSTRTSRAGGQGSATIAFSIKRLVTGTGASGTVTLTSGSRTKTVRLVKGKAKVTLKGLPAGLQPVTATYSGTSSTAGFTKTYSITVK